MPLQLGDAIYLLRGDKSDLDKVLKESESDAAASAGRTQGLLSNIGSGITSFIGMLLIVLPTLAIMHEHFTLAVTIWLVLLSLLLLGAIASTILISAFLPRISTRFLKGPRLH